MVLPGLFSAEGELIGFGLPKQIAEASAPQSLDAGDLNGDGFMDVMVVDRDTVLVIYGKPPSVAQNNTPATARQLGTVVQYVEQKQTIIPGQEDAYYLFTVPTEAARGSGDEVVDFSALFEATEGAGLSMEGNGS